MAEPAAFAPFVLKDCLATVATYDYQAQLSGVTITPSTSKVTWQGLKPTSQFTDQSPATWTADIDYAQDWESANSFSQFLHEHEGETVAFRFAPINGGAAFTANVVITPGAIGGKVNAFATSSVSLGVSGKPAYVAA